jgi:hypothetical protein
MIMYEQGLVKYTHVTPASLLKARQGTVHNDRGPAFPVSWECGR